MTDRKTCYVGLRITAELYEAAKARAAAQSKATGLRVTVSDVLRQALTEAVRVAKLTAKLQRQNDTHDELCGKPR